MRSSWSRRNRRTRDLESCAPLVLVSGHPKHECAAGPPHAYCRRVFFGITDPRDALRHASSACLRSGALFLTVSGLIAIYVDPTEPARLAELTYAVLFGYSLRSIIVLAFVHRATRLAPRDGEILHGIDIFWTAALTFRQQRTRQPVLPVLPLRATRSGLSLGIPRDHPDDGGDGWDLSLRDGHCRRVGTSRGFRGRTWRPIARFLRVTYFVLTGCLIGYLAEQEKELRAGDFGRRRRGASASRGARAGRLRHGCLPRAAADLRRRRASTS